MISAWTQHIKDPAEKQRFINQLVSAKPVIERLLEILDGNEFSVDRSEMDISTYDCPSWPYKQAHNNGYRACLRKMKAILTLDQKD